jgi:glucosamine 6-phosphate synthetase-like amidotransferase/phosphosugar isomerase protein
VDCWPCQNIVRFVDRGVETVTLEGNAVKKGGYDHYMRKEIHEQFESLRQTIAGAAQRRPGARRRRPRLQRT